jgi:hypothetical protein
MTGPMITQLNPPLPMHTPKGDGLAHFVIDYGPEFDLLWVVFMNADGACWSVPNRDVRMSFNWTMGRRRSEESRPPHTQSPLSVPESADASRVRVFPRAADV